MSVEKELVTVKMTREQVGLIYDSLRAHERFYDRDERITKLRHAFNILQVTTADTTAVQRVDIVAG